MTAKIKFHDYNKFAFSAVLTRQLEREFEKSYVGQSLTVLLVEKEGVTHFHVTLLGRLINGSIAQHHAA